MEENTNNSPNMKLNENELAKHFLSAHHAIEALLKPCDHVRLSAKCPNDKMCKGLFDSNGGIPLILRERQKIWRYDSRVRDRKQRFHSIVLSMLCVDKTNQKWIDWRLNGLPVCKSFYRAVSAIPEKMFNQVVSDILQEEDLEDETSTRFKCKPPNEMAVIAFLDCYFKGMEGINVENAPDAFGGNAGLKFMRYRWKELYDDVFVPNQKDLKQECVDYNKFCEIRKRERPHYKKHRKVRTSKRWPHTECPDCVSLRTEEAKARALCRIVANKSIEEVEANKIRLQTALEQLQHHFAIVQASHDHYSRTIQKAIMNKHCDLSISVDSAGTSVMSHGLYFKENVVVGQPQQFKCLNVKNTFVIVHGWGTLIFQSYPDYETQGANLIIEIVFRTLKIVMEKRRLRRLRNLYIQFDNHTVNKNFALISAFGALSLLGICQKVKPTYGKRGHCHARIDALIGQGSTAIVSKAIPSFSVFQTLMENAFTEMGEILIERIVGITDYSLMFAGTVPEGTISGIKKAQTFRITACSDGSGIEVYYKFDVSKRGWLPRPLPATLCNQWKDEFTHPVSPINQGFPMSGEVFAIDAPGRRLEYNYVIKYHGGDTQRFIRKCISLPFKHMTLSSVVQRVSATIRQPIKPEAHKKLNQAQQNIKKVLQIRQEVSFISEWDDFFSSIPMSNDIAHISYQNAVLDLSKIYGGAIKKKEKVFTTYRCADDYVDPIIFEGGPMNFAERKAILETINKTDSIQTKKRKKTTSKQKPIPKKIDRKKKQVRDVTSESSQTDESDSDSELSTTEDDKKPTIRRQKIVRKIKEELSSASENSHEDIDSDYSMRQSIQNTSGKDEHPQNTQSKVANKVDEEGFDNGNEYLKLRETNIQRNNDFLQQLGLPKIQPSIKKINKAINEENENYDKDFSSMSEENDNEYNYEALSVRQRNKHHLMITKYYGKTFQDIDDDGNSYSGNVVDIVKETTSGDICFQYNIVGDNGVLINAEPKYIVLGYAISNACKWLNLDETIIQNKHEQVSFSTKNSDKQKKRSSTSAIDNNKKPSFSYELIPSKSIFEPEIFNSKTKRTRINKI